MRWAAAGQGAGAGKQSMDSMDMDWMDGVDSSPEEMWARPCLPALFMKNPPGPLRRRGRLKEALTSILSQRERKH
jgi:hypothetical protein